jgi:hypothetical protein
MKRTAMKRPLLLALFTLIGLVFIALSGLAAIGYANDWLLIGGWCLTASMISAIIGVVVFVVGFMNLTERLTR